MTLTPLQRHRAGVGERDPYVCAMFPHRNCTPKKHLHADHVIDQSYIKRRHSELRLRQIGTLTKAEVHFIHTPLDELLADPRNGWFLCEFGNMNKVALGITREDIRPETEEFAAEFGLDGYLDRHFGERS